MLLFSLRDVVVVSRTLRLYALLSVIRVATP